MSIVIVLVLFYGTISCETTYPNQILYLSTGLESWTAQATTCTEAVAATQKIDELGNIGDDRSFLSLKVIFCSLQVATSIAVATFRSARRYVICFKSSSPKWQPLSQPSLFPKFQPCPTGRHSDNRPEWQVQTKRRACLCQSLSIAWKVGLH